MKRLILWLIAMHNKRSKYKVFVYKPEVFIANITAHIDVMDYEGNEDLLKNVLAEKKYDCRQALLDQIHKTGMIKEEIKIETRSVLITSKINVITWEK